MDGMGGNGMRRDGAGDGMRWYWRGLGGKGWGETGWDGMGWSGMG